MSEVAAPVTLRAVTRHNFDDVIGLHVADDQLDFLNSNVEAVAWASVAPESRVFAVYSGETVVGLATYGYLPDDGRCWISHLMVDESRQRAGTGRAALEQLLELMTVESGGADILVAVNPDNRGAIRLYEQYGFVDTGRQQNGETVMRRPAG